MSQIFYPEVECSELPLTPGEAPRDGCECFVCGWLRQASMRLVPRVVRRDPYVGVLERSDAAVATTIGSNDHPNLLARRR